MTQVAKAALKPGGVIAFKLTEGFCSVHSKPSCRIVPMMYNTMVNTFGRATLAAAPMSLYQSVEAVFMAFKEPQPNPEVKNNVLSFCLH